MDGKPCHNQYNLYPSELMERDMYAWKKADTALQLLRHKMRKIVICEVRT
jgi:hypothetical protein